MHYLCKHIHVCAGVCARTHTHTHTHLYISGNQRFFHKNNVGCTLIYLFPKLYWMLYVVKDWETINMTIELFLNQSIVLLKGNIGQACLKVYVYVLHTTGDPRKESHAD